MIIRKLSDIEKTKRNVHWGNGQSRRFLIEEDGIPFSLTDTIVKAGTESFLQYPNHIEVCYCIAGEGELEYEGKIIELSPGIMYAPNKHDKHCLRAKTDVRLICIFSPPLKGHEKHEFSSDNDEVSLY